MEDRTELKLTRKDYTHVLRDSCEMIASAANSALQVLSAWPEKPLDGASLDRSLVKMALAERQASRLIIPSPDALEYFGLPRSATARAFDPDPTIRVDDPAREAWDFRPWLSEKLTHLSEFVFSVLQTTELIRQEPDPAGPDFLAANSGHGPLQSSSASEESPTLRLKDQAMYETRAAREYALGILSAIDSMGLSVIDWRLDAS